MGMNLLDLGDALLMRRTHILWDDFDHYTDTDIWTKLVTGAGASVANSDNKNGLLSLTGGAVADNEAAVATTRKDWLLANNKPILFEARINFTQANVNQMQLAVGVADTLNTTLFYQAAKAGLRASWSGAIIYTSAGQLNWLAASSLTTTITTATSKTVAGGSADQVLRIELRPVTSTLAEVSYFVNGQPLLDTNFPTPKPIKQNFTYTGIVKLQAGVFLKCGSASSEVCNVDYIACNQLR